jgi:chemotaxis protein methyltransferase CheR
MTSMRSGQLRDEEFFLSCIDHLLINLTALFRNHELWDYISDVLLKELKGNNQIDIWHAGCSTGEEVYTMGIVLHHKLLLSKCKVLATDLSDKALAQAKQGGFNRLLLQKYSDSFSRHLPDSSFDHYFNTEGKTISVNNFLRKHIEFLKHNLIQDPFPPLNSTSFFAVMF